MLTMLLVNLLLPINLHNSMFPIFQIDSFYYWIPTKNIKMDPVINAQDVVRCSLCKTTVAPMHCENCYINLCKDCIVNHISDSSKFHNMVPLKYRGPTPNYPKCLTHTTKQWTVWISLWALRHSYLFAVCFLGITQGA